MGALQTQECKIESLEAALATSDAQLEKACVNEAAARSGAAALQSWEAACAAEKSVALMALASLTVDMQRTVRACHAKCS